MRQNPKFVKGNKLLAPLRTDLKVARKTQILGDRRPGQYYRGNLLVFEMGPSEKFVSAIKDAIFNKKKFGSIFCRKKGGASF